VNSGIFCFAQVANFNKVAIDAKQIQHEYGDEDGSIKEVNLLRAIADNNFKAKAVNLKSQNISPGTLQDVFKRSHKKGQLFSAVILTMILPIGTAMSSHIHRKLGQVFIL
jgi:subfamily B ATP-binding cassette protein HlyB/CyaB